MKAVAADSARTLRVNIHSYLIHESTSRKSFKRDADLRGMFIASEMEGRSEDRQTSGERGVLKSLFGDGKRAYTNILLYLHRKHNASSVVQDVHVLS